MIDFERFWAEGDAVNEDQDEGPDAMEGEARPGASANEICDWEKKYGVRLPEPIRTALRLRNGGYVRNASIEVLPLMQIAPVDDDFWEWTEIEAEEAPDRGLMFVFGEETETGGTLLMNFNARGPQYEPSVYIDHHGESTYLVNAAFGGFFQTLLASSEVPGVDWSETEELSVVARESIDLSALYDGKPASLDQVLARQKKALLLFTRQRSPEGEILTRTTLPLPLDSAWAEVSPYRPAPISTYALHLQPEETDDIVAKQSQTNDDGRWKNSSEEGAPIYVTFESTDREGLKSLRKELFGAKGAARAQARQDRQTKLEETLDALSPEQRTAAMLQAALAMKGKMDLQIGAGLGETSGMPPELAKAVQMMQNKMQQMVQKAQEQIAANPVDAEVLRQFDGVLGELDEE